MSRTLDDVASSHATRPEPPLFVRAELDQPGTAGAAYLADRAIRGDGR